MRIHLPDLPDLYRKHPEFKRGCITDTNALFARSVELDALFSWTDAAFEQFVDLGIPVFTNINIRLECLTGKKHAK